jgi:hypothetical protein
LAKTKVVALPDKVALPVEDDNVPVPVQNGAMASDVAKPIQVIVTRKRGKKLDKGISEELAVTHVENQIPIGETVNNVIPIDSRGKILSDTLKPIEKANVPFESAELVEQEKATIGTVVPDDQNDVQLEEALIDKENGTEVIFDKAGEKNESASFDYIPPDDVDIEANIESGDHEDVSFVDKEYIEMYEGSSPGLRGRLPDINDAILEVAKQFLLKDGRVQLDWGCGDTEIMSIVQFQTLCENRYS